MNTPEPLDPAQTIRNMIDPILVTRGRVMIIGVGGIGVHLSRATVSFLAGLGMSFTAGERIEIVLVDGDAFALENTYRMDIPDFGNKAMTIACDLLQRLESTAISLRYVEQYVTAENAPLLINEGDCVLLACDNHATRQLVGRHCAGLANVVLISGGNDGVESGMRGTYGNVQVYVRKNGQNVTAPIDQFHPEIAHPTDQLPGEASCLELAAAGAAQLVYTNLAVASTMCGALLRLLMPADDDAVMYDEVALDIYDAVSVPHYFGSSKPTSVNT